MTARSPSLHRGDGPDHPATACTPDSAARTQILASGHPTARTITNALSIDVEDYFQVTALSGRIDREDWPNLSLRVERNTDAILDLLARCQLTATFFVLGWIAERCPELVRRIADGGHEIASHGYAHIRVHEQDAAAFRKDVGDTRRLLEDISGATVQGYRAASFSLSPEMDWAYGSLVDAGYRYSSSLHPIRHDLYSAPDAPRHPFRPLGDAPIAEIPVSTLNLWGRRWPCGGGGYFRLLPYAVSRWAIGRLHCGEGAPCVFYFHPWEIDPDQPRVRALSIKSRFRHYTNLSAMEPKLVKLFGDFQWSRIDRVFEDVIPA